MKVLRFCILGFLIADSSYAAPLDCDQLKKTRIPFQVTLSASTTGGVTPSGEAAPTKTSEGIIQVYRNDEGFVIQYSTNSASDRPSKAIFRFGLVQSSNFFYSQRVQSNEFTYTPPMDADLKAQKKDFSLKSSLKTIIDGHESNSEAQMNYRYVGQESVIVGPCVFVGLKYEMQTKVFDGSNERNLPLSFYVYSPELNTNLSFSNAYKIKDEPERRTTTVAKSIVTDFIPMPQN